MFSSFLLFQEVRNLLAFSTSMDDKHQFVVDSCISSKTRLQYYCNRVLNAYRH